MEEEEEEKQKEYFYYYPPQPTNWFTKIISFQADIIYNSITLLLSPFTLFFSMVFESYRRTAAATARIESGVIKIPVRVTSGSVMLVRKIGLGFMGAVHVVMVLISVMIFAGFLGVGLVQFWVEEPIFMKERLFFDYTDLNPKAVYSFDSKKQMGVPVGHTFLVSLELLMPESDYNRQIGVFQLTAELLSSNGVVISKSSQPCMLKFRSLPIRLIRTCLMSIPLVLGISGETQKLSIQVLNHKEGYYSRTKFIRITLIPRAGTSYLLQLYEAEIFMNSKLPWLKGFVRNWKWTISIWVSLYIYIALLIVMLCCCRPLLFPLTALSSGERDDGDRDMKEDEEKEMGSKDDEREVSELLRKWQERRKRRRKMMVSDRDITGTETVGSSASSISITREDSSLVGEDSGDSEYVNLGD